jgi:hypothetical protein
MNKKEKRIFEILKKTTVLLKNNFQNLSYGLMLVAMNDKNKI